MLITSRRLVSLPNRHVAAISYGVTLLNAQAHVVISSEMSAEQPTIHTDTSDPRQPKVAKERVLHAHSHYGEDHRIMLCHVTRNSDLRLVCATDHTLKTATDYRAKLTHTDDFGQVAFTIEAKPGCPVHLSKYIVYHTSETASIQELCGRAGWTMDRIADQGFEELLTSQEQHVEAFWNRSDIRGRDVRGRVHQAHDR